MMITPQRGRQLSGTFIAVRYRYDKSGQWILDMPVRDRKFGILGSTPVSWKHQSEKIPATEHNDPPKENEYRWFYVPYGWSWGIYIGKVRKHEGVKEYIDYDTGYELNHYKRKTVSFGCVALKGVRGGFVLAYIPLKEIRRRAGGVGAARRY